MTPDQQESLDRALHKLMFVMTALFIFSIFSLASVLIAKMAEHRAVKAEIGRIEMHLQKIDEQNRRSLLDRLDLRKRVEADR